MSGGVYSDLKGAGEGAESEVNNYGRLPCAWDADGDGDRADKCVTGRMRDLGTVPLASRRTEQRKEEREKGERGTPGSWPWSDAWMHDGLGVVANEVGEVASEMASEWPMAAAGDGLRPPSLLASTGGCLRHAALGLTTLTTESWFRLTVGRVSQTAPSYAKALYGLCTADLQPRNLSCGVAEIVPERLCVG
jgi:hypothetical protein